MRRAHRDVAGAPPITPAPTIVFHGDEDDVVHPCNADHVVAQSAASHAIDAGAPSGAIPGGIVTEGTVPGGHRYTCTSYRDASGRTVLENWTVHGGGHAWSGGSPSGSFTDQRGPDATREMMRFFAASRAGATTQ